MPEPSTARPHVEDVAIARRQILHPVFTIGGRSPGSFAVQVDQGPANVGFHAAAVTADVDDCTGVEQPADLGTVVGDQVLDVRLASVRT